MPTPPLHPVAPLVGCGTPLASGDESVQPVVLAVVGDSVVHLCLGWQASDRRLQGVMAAQRRLQALAVDVDDPMFEAARLAGGDELAARMREVLEVPVVAGIDPHRRMWEPRALCGKGASAIAANDEEVARLRATARGVAPAGRVLCTYCDRTAPRLPDMRWALPADWRG